MVTRKAPRATSRTLHSSAIMGYSLTDLPVERVSGRDDLRAPTALEGVAWR